MAVQQKRKTPSQIYQMGQQKTSRMKPPKLKKGSIVKVQLPLMSNDPQPLALVYNRSRSYDVDMIVSKALIKAMKGQPKKFWYAHYDPETNNTVLEREAPVQNW